MLKTPEGRAWAILLTAFAIFCTLVVTIPLGIRWYVINATTSQSTTLEKPIDGEVYLRGRGRTAFIAVAERQERVLEGTTIKTSEHSRAFLRLFEDSTLMLYNNTEVVLERVRRPRYSLSPRPNCIRLRVERGRVAIGVSGPTPPTERKVTLTVRSPHATITLAEGRYSVVVDDEGTQFTILLPGEAQVIARGQARLFRNGRCRIASDGTIEGPLPPEQNLIVNGDFSSLLDRGWEKLVPHRQDPNDPFGTVEIVAANGKTMLAFRRHGARTHGETGVLQRIDKDVRDFSWLKLTCEVLVNEQSLPGGGYESSEFPVMVELNYKDAMGNLRSRHWGFYYLDPGTGPEWKTLVNGIKVIQGEWYLFESDNLMQSLGDARPVHIVSVRIYASGWDWDSAITNISLLVQE